MLMWQRCSVFVMKGKAFQQGVVWKGSPGTHVWRTVELVRQHSDGEHRHESAIRRGSGRHWWSTELQGKFNLFIYFRTSILERPEWQNSHVSSCFSSSASNRGCRTVEVQVELEVTVSICCSPNNPVYHKTLLLGLGYIWFIFLCP